MIPVSEGFIRCLREGGQRVSRLTAVDEDLNRIVRFRVESGSMQMNGDDAVRRSMDAIAWSDEFDMIPRSDESIVHILGNQMLLESGWMVDGQAELVPCGVYMLRDIKVSRGAKAVQVSVNGMDRSVKVQRESSRPVSIRSNSQLPDAIEALVTSQYPNARFNMPDEGTMIPSLLFEARTDIWEEARNLVKAAGMRLYFDTIGQCSISSPFMSLDSTFVLDYLNDLPIDELSRSISADDLYNGVVVFGTHSGGATVTGSAYITDPKSDYRVDGKMGKVPKIIESEKVTTPTQARNVAHAELREMVALADQLEFQAVPNAALDYGDVIRCEDPDTGITGQWYVLGYDLPLASGEMSRITAGKVLGDLA